MKSKQYITAQFYLLLFFILGILCFVFVIFSFFDVQFYEFCFPMTFFLFLTCMFLFRKQQPIVFLDFYIFLYFMNLFYYFYQGSQLSEHVLFQKSNLFEKVCLLFYIFYYIQFCLYRKNKQICDSKLTIIRNDKLDFCSISNTFLIFVTFCLLLLSYRIGTDMFRTGFNYTVYKENLKVSSVIPALFIITFSIYAFSKHRKKFLCYFFCFAYLYFCLSRGFRVTAIPAILVIYLAFYEGRIPNLIFIVFLFCCILVVLAIGLLKDTGSIDINKLLTSSHHRIVISHHADILYTATSTFGLVESGIINPIMRIGLGISFFLQSLILPSMFPDILRYPLIITYFTTNGGGGMFLAGAYLFWGWVGVLLTSYFINYFFIKVYSTKSNQFRLGIAIVFVFCCNWISYDFHTILRFPVYALMLYWLLTHFNWRYLKNEKSIGRISH